MDKPREEDTGTDRKIDEVEVPEKQLHRWKDEGGALSPDPEPDPDSE